MRPAFDDEYAAWGRPLVVSPSTLAMFTIELPGSMTRAQACAIQ